MTCLDCGGSGERPLISDEGDHVGDEPCGCNAGGNLALAQAEEKAAAAGTATA